jgi:hypothetical protein
LPSAFTTNLRTAAYLLIAKTLAANTAAAVSPSVRPRWSKSQGRASSGAEDASSRQRSKRINTKEKRAIIEIVATIYYTYLNLKASKITTLAI